MAARALQIDALLSGFLDANGDAYNGGSLTVYDEGTTNLSTIYSKADKSSSAANPITLDTFGSVASPIFVDGKVKLVLKDSGGSTIKTWDELTYELLQVTTETKTSVYNSAGMNFDDVLGDALYIQRSTIFGASPQTTGVNGFGYISISDIPIGAKIIRIDLYGKLAGSTSGDQIFATLDAYNIGAATLSSTVSFSQLVGNIQGSGDVTSFEAISPHTILDSLRYILKIQMKSTGLLTIFYAVKITYTKSYINGID